MKDSFQKESKSLKAELKNITKRFKMEIIKEEINNFGIKIVLLNQTTGVNCSFSPREGKGWIVDIGRVNNGEFPKHPIFIKKETKLDFFNLRDIAILRMKYITELEEEIKNSLPLSPQAISYLLENCCADLLEGNFTVFKELDFLIKKRVLSKGN